MSKIFGIGWAKTGTTTLGKCFQMLGYNHQTQRLDLVKDLAIGDLSRTMALAQEKDTFEDWPWIILYKELDREFPGSRFILTARDSSNWLRSYKNMLQSQGDPTAELNEIRSILYGLPFPNVSDAELVQRYEKHNADVLAHFRNRQDALLVLDWERGAGWKELCSFLNKPIPQQPFPHENRGDYNPFRRIVILSGTYHGRNLGDIAMLIVAIRRLRDAWPNAQITVLTYETEPFLKHCPEVALFSLSKRDACLDGGAQCDAEQFLDLLRTADLFLMSGCGAINDVWSTNAIRILETFEMAIRLDVPTAMMGQGIGPLRDSALLAAAKRVLPKVQMVGLRDAQSRELLSSLGVAADRIHLTGDDALELAYSERVSEGGDDIGINLRLADYAGITETTAANYAQILSVIARQHGCRLLGLPISQFRGESDCESLSRAVGALNVPFDDGSELDTTLKVIQRTRDCRVVVTASYHAAVFALAMGIPAIGIAHSEYYLQKFDGLAGLFGDGCVMVDAAQTEADTELARWFDRLWNDAPRLRESLLRAAADQIGKGRAAYEAVSTLRRRRNPDLYRRAQFVRPVQTVEPVKVAKPRATSR